MPNILVVDDDINLLKSIMFLKSISKPYQYFIKANIKYNAKNQSFKFVCINLV